MADHLRSAKQEKSPTFLKFPQRNCFFSVNTAQIIPLFTSLCEYHSKSKGRKLERAETPAPTLLLSFCLFIILARFHDEATTSDYGGDIGYQFNIAPGANEHGERKKTTTKKAAHKKAPVESPVERQIRELREQMHEPAGPDRRSQTAECRQGREACRRSAVGSVPQLPPPPHPPRLTASAPTSRPTPTPSPASTAPSPISRPPTSASPRPSATPRSSITDAIESPLATPLQRSRQSPRLPSSRLKLFGVSAHSTPTSTRPSTPPRIPGAAQAHTSELNFSGRQSSVGALFVGNPGPFKLSGYVEADFLGAGATSNDNQSNSYVLRQRQIWGQVATNSGFTVTGGQMWSLVTETKSQHRQPHRKPSCNHRRSVPRRFQLGASARRPVPAEDRWLHRCGLSSNRPQIIYSATNANANFFIGNAGAGGGLYNLTANYSNNVAPDVIVKVTYDCPLRPL